MCTNTLNHIYHQRLISQTKLLASHVNQSCHDHALSLFTSMYSHLTPLVDPFVFPLALKSCSALHHSHLGKSIHAHTFKASLLVNPFVACALVDMYGKCVTIKDARKLFDEITNRNVVVWNSMISLYSRERTSTDVSTALNLFEIMDVEPNASTFNSIMGALSELDHDDNGGCSSSSKAFGFYRKMEAYGVKPNLITVLALLPACVGLGALNLVKEIHGYSVRTVIHSDAQVSSGLIEAYGRCGCISSARLVFDRLLGRDVVAWSSMVSAYAFNGEAKKALEVFTEMELEKVKPDGIAYLGVLKACSHAGLADEAQMFFSRMQKNEYGINVGSDHYACLVDVLSRAGRLHEAYEVIKEMPMKATAKAWGALLGACRSYGEVELAEIAGRVLFEIEPENGGNYVLLASVYAGAGRLDDAERVRRYMKDRGVMTLPGSSWVMGKKKNSDTQQ